MVDEMDLLSGLKAARSVRPDAYEEARGVLRAAIGIQESMNAPASAPRHRSHWGRGRLMGFTAVGLAAVAASVTLVVTSTPAPAAKTTAAAGNPLLTRLAADITAKTAPLPGNATLEIRNRLANSAKVQTNGIDLYTDGGAYFWGNDASELSKTVAEKEPADGGEFKQAITAALIAAKGDVAAARVKMAVANYPGGVAPAAPPAPTKAEIEKIKAVDKAQGKPYTAPKPLTAAQKKEQTDNFIWMNATGALTAAPENAQVRAGVLKILATMPNVEVTHTVTAGQATLTMTDSWPTLDPGYLESWVINASDGFPVAQSGHGGGSPSQTTYYHVSRVTLAQVAVGKF
jgi:hypothetical protein